MDKPHNDKPRNDTPLNSPFHTPGYETRDANVRGVLNFLVILAAVLVGTGLVCWGMFHFFSAHIVDQPVTNSPFFETRQLPMGIQLQVNPLEDFRKFKAEQEKSLEAYSENRAAGTARVPIEVAMDMLVKKGLPLPGEPQAQPVAAQPAVAQTAAPEAGKKP